LFLIGGAMILVPEDPRLLTNPTSYILRVLLRRGSNFPSGSDESKVSQRRVRRRGVSIWRL